MRRILASLITAVLLFYAAPSAHVRAQTTAQTDAQTAVGSRVGATSPLKLTLPLKEGSVRFAVIGDTGTGTDKQQQLADWMIRYKEAYPFEFVLLVGDNMYGGESPQDFQLKFENVYKKLLDKQVKFYATLGNHDEANQRFYEHFNMNGEEYYRFTKGNVSFYSLNSNYMDSTQIKWMEEQFLK